MDALVFFSNPASRSSTLASAQDNLGSSMKKIAVYMSCFGGYDHPLDPLWRTDIYDFFYFSDVEYPHLKVWQHLPTLEEARSLDLRHQSKYHKIMGYRHFSDYEYTIYIDANLLCINGEALIYRYIFDTAKDFIIQKHPRPNNNMKLEVETCIRLNKDSHEKITKQYESYLAQGYQEHFITMEAGIMVRRTASEEVFSLCKDWWQEILTHSFRDQISLPFVFSKYLESGLKWHVVPNLLRTRNAFILFGHLKKKKNFQVQRWNFKRMKLQLFAWLIHRLAKIMGQKAFLS
jgi:hypothetical protein